MKPQPFVPIFTSLHEWEVQLVRHALEAEGIDAFVENAGVVGVNWLYANAVGGVQLLVAEEDVRQAEAIIQAMRTGTQVITQTTAKQAPHCPQCRSADVRSVRWTALGVLGGLLLLGIPFLFRGRSRCQDCGHTWNP